MTKLATKDGMADYRMDILLRIASLTIARTKF